MLPFGWRTRGRLGLSAPLTAVTAGRGSGVAGASRLARTLKAGPFSVRSASNLDYLLVLPNCTLLTVQVPGSSAITNT